MSQRKLVKPNLVSVLSGSVAQAYSASLPQAFPKAQNENKLTKKSSHMLSKILRLTLSHLHTPLCMQHPAETQTNQIQL